MMMSDFISAVRRQTGEFFKKRSKTQKVLMGIGAAVLVAVIVLVAALSGKVEYEVLYTGLDEAEAGDIMVKLEDMGVAAKAQGSSTILVPVESADKTRMTLASEGYPKSGLNYDLFGSSATLGATDLQMQTYLQYQLQENLRSTILKLDRIKDCVVIINMPSESLFVLSTDETAASASVMVEVKDGEKLANEEVKAIANLVLKSVSGLELENISIVDSSMNLYDVTGETEEAYTTTQYELTQLTQETLKQQVLSVLTPVFGEDNVSAAVNAVLNFDRETVSSVEFDTPKEDADNGLAVSMEELYEPRQGGETEEGTPGTDTNGVALSEYVYEDAELSDFQTISRAVNYELNELHTQIEKQQGTVEKLSVAVLLNSSLNNEDYSESIVRLVSNAIGVDESSVTVESLPFMENQNETELSEVFDEQATVMDSLKKKELTQTLIIAGTAVLLVLVVLGFLRSIFRSRNANNVAVASAGETIDVWVDEDEHAEPEGLSDITLNGKSKSVEKIEDFVEKNPAAAAQLLRNWLLDDEM
jgi:flagellar M-ring protein FliF